MRHFRQHVRGDAPHLNAPALDRRTWPRETVRSPEAALSWFTTFGESSQEARLVNLSRGGAGLLVRVAPPPGATLRLTLPDARGEVISGRVVATREHPARGWRYVHMRFDRDCPERLLAGLLDEGAEADA